MRKNKWLIITIGAAITGFIIGYSVGYGNAISLCINTGERLLNIQLKPEAYIQLVQRFPEIRALLS